MRHDDVERFLTALKLDAQHFRRFGFFVPSTLRPSTHHSNCRYCSDDSQPMQNGDVLAGAGITAFFEDDRPTFAEIAAD